MWIRLKSKGNEETLFHSEMGVRIRLEEDDSEWFTLYYIYPGGKGCYPLDTSKNSKEIKREFEKIAEEFKNKGELIDLRWEEKNEQHN